jgi:hypothetical protein
MLSHGRSLMAARYNRRPSGHDCRRENSERPASRFPVSERLSWNGDTAPPFKLFRRQQCPAEPEHMASHVIRGLYWRDVEHHHRQDYLTTGVLGLAKNKALLAFALLLDTLHALMRFDRLHDLS